LIRSGSSVSGLATAALLFASLLVRPTPTSGGPIAWGTVGKACVTCAAAAACCLEIVTTGDECLVERLGKYHRRLGPGYHFVLRPLERVSYRTTTRERVLDIPPQRCFTIDNAPLSADAVVFLRIFDLVKARYAVDDVMTAILNLCLTSLREAVGKLTLDESFSSRDQINAALLSVIDEVCRGWGVEVTRVEMQNLEPSPDILAAMELQMAAERKKRASILKSEGERTTLTNEAEGRAQALLADAEAKRQSIIKLAAAERERMMTEAEGMEEAIKRVAGAISSCSGSGSDKVHQKDVDKALQLIMLTRYMETQAKFASSEGTKVLMFPTKDSVPLTYDGLKNLLTM